jgi:hypothetical protein
MWSGGENSREGEREQSERVTQSTIYNAAAAIDHDGCISKIEKKEKRRK